MTSTNVWAETPPSDAAPSEQPVLDPATATVADGATKSRAAALFDEGTSLYARAEFARAAEAFLQADAVVPTSKALENAIAAARKAQAHLLVVRASERAMAREAQDPELAARARAALVEAEGHLARLQVSCAPSPCVVFLDGGVLDDARLHLAPGSYRLSAQAGVSREFSASGSVTERFTALAGAEYRFALEVATDSESGDAPTTAAPEPLRDSEPRVDDDGAAAAPGLPPWVFYSGVGVSGILAVVTAWSGFDTLDQKSALPSREAPGYAGASNDVTSAAQRTDLLLAASLLAAASTTALGFWWTEWGQEQRVELGSSLLLQGAELRLRGRFH